MSKENVYRFQLQVEAMRFSFGWLVAANLVGCLMAILLIRPEWGQFLGVLTYGRWMPLHMEWHLYGWCSLPLVGLFLREFVSGDSGGIGDVRLALVIWSIGLFAGGIAFLVGISSGKLFLGWHGWTRAFFPLCLCIVWSILATNWLRSLKDCGAGKTRMAFRAVLLLALACVPLALYMSASRNIYPPVNPRSGGATGHSLLVSSLGIVFLFGLVPYILGRRRRASQWFPAFWSLLGFSFLVYLFIQHGSVANTATDQIAGLGILLIMVPALIGYIRLWEWPAGAGPWLAAFLFWWGLLTLNGWITFLPGILGTLKFTNALVAHAHLAMAGMITALNFLILSALAEREGDSPGSVFGGRIPFIVWNGACILMVCVLFIQGIREGRDPGALFGKDALTSLIYFIRAGSGLLMLGASVAWLVSACRNKSWV
jgi:cytochrome c oxidase cbb3-type subunit 1